MPKPYNKMLEFSLTPTCAECWRCVYVLQGDGRGCLRAATWDIPHRYWLVVSIPLKNISQLGLLFPIYGKIKIMSKPPTRWHSQSMSIWCEMRNVHAFWMSFVWSCVICRFEREVLRAVFNCISLTVIPRCSLLSHGDIWLQGMVSKKLLDLVELYRFWPVAWQHDPKSFKSRSDMGLTWSYSPLVLLPSTACVFSCHTLLHPDKDTTACS
jgi:hypothetical protein